MLIKIILKAPPPVRSLSFIIKPRSLSTKEQVAWQIVYLVSSCEGYINGFLFASYLSLAPWFHSADMKCHFNPPHHHTTSFIIFHYLRAIISPNSHCHKDHQHAVCRLMHQPIHHQSIHPPIDYNNTHIRQRMRFQARTGKKVVALARKLTFVPLLKQTTRPKDAPCRSK